MSCHDARHLPFSHMMEEVFRELNWSEVPPLLLPNIDALLREVKKTAGGMLLEDWWARVEDIQQGRSGVPWLEAIVDSALDADKIEYIFNDSSLTGQGVRLASIGPWLEDFVNGQSLTPEGLIRLQGGACEASLALLQERMHLYRSVYLTPELRSLEAVVRYIVTTWLEWKVPEKLGRADHGKRCNEYQNDERPEDGSGERVIVGEIRKFGNSERGYGTRPYD